MNAGKIPLGDVAVGLGPGDLDRADAHGFRADTEGRLVVDEHRVDRRHAELFKRGDVNLRVRLHRADLAGQYRRVYQGDDPQALELRPGGVTAVGHQGGQHAVRP